MSSYPMFDVHKLRLAPLAERQHDMTLDDVLALDDPFERSRDPNLAGVARAIVEAKAKGCKVVFMMGAHVVKQGCSRILIDLMERRLVDHVATNGAGAIHDFELALIGASTESVARYIQTGMFGMWEETSRINDAVREGAARGMGFGEAVGRVIVDREFAHRDVSILAAGVRLGIPVTVHVCFGQDIIHQHPNFDAAVTGLATYRDFLIFAEAVRRLEGGVLICAGSAVMGPEVFLKALSMARNVAAQDGEEVRRFTTAVFDLVPLSGDLSQEAPKTDARYYFRPWKTLLIRTVKDGGTSYYVQGDHRSTLPTLRREILE
jgi:hypothetical protein